MEKVDLVMVGAEGVAESGGVINKVNKWMNYYLYNNYHNRLEHIN